MSCQGGGSLLGSITVSECPRGHRTRRPQKTLVRADPTTPPALLLSRPAHGPLSHSLPAIAAVSLVRAPYGLCLGRDMFPARGIAPCAFPSCSFCKAACPRGGREVGKGVAGLITEPFRCQEVFPCLSPNPSPGVPGKAVCWKKVCACSTDTDFSAVFFWKYNKLSLAGSPRAPRGCEFVLEAWEETRTVLGTSTHCPCGSNPRMSFPCPLPRPWVGCLAPLCCRALVACSCKAAEQTGRVAGREGLLLQQIQHGVAGSQAVLQERGAPGAPPIVTSLLPDPAIHPTISWGWVPRAFQLVLLVIGTLSSSTEEQSVARDGPCGGGRREEGWGNRLAVVVFDGFAVLPALTHCSSQRVSHLSPLY